jgi:hypothetical protein
LVAVAIEKPHAILGGNVDHQFVRAGRRIEDKAVEVGGLVINCQQVKRIILGVVDIGRSVGGKVKDIHLRADKKIDQTHRQGKPTTAPPLIGWVGGIGWVKSRQARSRQQHATHPKRTHILGAGNAKAGNGKRCDNSSPLFESDPNRCSPQENQKLENSSLILKANSFFECVTQFRSFIF